VRDKVIDAASVSPIAVRGDHLQSLRLPASNKVHWSEIVVGGGHLSGNNVHQDIGGVQFGRECVVEGLKVRNDAALWANVGCPATGGKEEDIVKALKNLVAGLVDNGHDSHAKARNVL